MTENKKTQGIQGFDPQVRSIEEEIVEFFSAKSSEFIGRSPIVSKVMTYFSIRKTLTQKELRELTGFSSGTISKTVNHLQAMNVITKETIPGTHTHVYRMDMLPFVSPRYFLQTETVMEQKIRKLEEMKNILEANKEEMEKFDSYKKIYSTVTQLLQILPTISVFLDRLEEKLETKR